MASNGLAFDLVPSYQQVYEKAIEESGIEERIHQLERSGGQSRARALDMGGAKGKIGRLLLDQFGRKVSYVNVDSDAKALAESPKTRKIGDYTKLPELFHNFQQVDKFDAVFLMNKQYSGFGSEERVTDPDQKVAFEIIEKSAKIDYDTISLLNGLYAMHRGGRLLLAGIMAPGSAQEYADFARDYGCLSAVTEFDVSMDSMRPEFAEIYYGKPFAELPLHVQEEFAAGSSSDDNRSAVPVSLIVFERGPALKDRRLLQDITAYTAQYERQVRELSR